MIYCEVIKGNTCENLHFYLATKSKSGPPGINRGSREHAPAAMGT